MQPPPHDQRSQGTCLPYGDNSLTAVLYRRDASRLLAYLYQHIQSAHDAEDLLFEVFLVVLEHEKKLSNMREDEQRAWLWTVARNRTIDYHRRTQQRRIVPLEHIAEMVDNERTPEQAALQQEEHDYLQVSLKQLSALQQEVVQLRFMGGLRCAEIATVLNKNEGAIRTMLSRALETLRNIYAQ